MSRESSRDGLGSDRRLIIGEREKAFSRDVFDSSFARGAKDGEMVRLRDSAP